MEDVVQIHIAYLIVVIRPHEECIDLGAWSEAFVVRVTYMPYKTECIFTIYMDYAHSYSCDLVLLDTVHSLSNMRYIALKKYSTNNTVISADNIIVIIAYRWNVRLPARHRHDG